MKKKYAFLVPLLLIGLCSCGNTQSSNNSSGSQTSPSSESLNSELTEEMLAPLRLGFVADSILKSGTDSTGYSLQCVETYCVEKAFTVKTYTSTDVDSTPTKDNLESEHHYASLSYMLGNMLSEIELGLNNEINYYLVVDSNNNYLTWNGAGYSNAFKTIEIDDFTKTDEEYVFSLNMNDDNNQSIYSNLPQQLSGVMGYELDSFYLKTDGKKIVSYEATFKPVGSLYGTVKTSICGNFISFGEDSVELIKPYEGAEDEEFQDALKLLKNYNFHAEVTTNSKIVEADVEDGNTIIYSLYDSKKNKTGNYGYYNKTDNTVQGITQINGLVYEDSEELSGQLSSLLPTFNISSVFFDKQNTDNGLLYTLKDNLSLLTAHGNEYGMLAGSIMGKLSIEITDDSVVMTNVLPNDVETYKYTNIGQISSLLGDKLMTTGDNLTWSDLGSNQPSEMEEVFEVVPKEALDQIPVIGGKYNYITVDASYRPGQPVFSISLDDYLVAVSLFDTMSEKLVANGFTLQDELGLHGGSLYQKNIVLNNQNKLLNVEIYAAGDYFQIPRFLMYPSIS